MSDKVMRYLKVWKQAVSKCEDPGNEGLDVLKAELDAIWSKFDNDDIALIADLYFHLDGRLRVGV